MNDADVYAEGDRQFELDEDRERDRRQCPIIRRDYPISDESRRLGEQDVRDARKLWAQSAINADEWLREYLEMRNQRSDNELDYNNGDVT